VVHCRHFGGQRQSVDLNLVRGCQWVGNNVQGLGAAPECFESRPDIFGPLDLWRDDFQRKRAGRCLDIEARQSAGRMAEASGITFRRAFETFFATKRKSLSNEKHAAQWQSTLKGK
jgi:hypothetical protein